MIPKRISPHGLSEKILRRDMAQYGKTTPEIYCTHTACMCCDYMSYESLVISGKPCPLCDVKEKALRDGYDEILSAAAGRPAPTPERNDEISDADLPWWHK